MSKKVKRFVSACKKPTRSSTTGYSSTISTCITLAMEANRPEGLDDVDISDGISDNVADEKSTVVGSAWYNLNGTRISRPTQRGIYIREDKMSDGTKKTLKVLIK